MKTANELWIELENCDTNSELEQSFISIILRDREEVREAFIAAIEKAVAPSGDQRDAIRAIRETNLGEPTV